MGQLRGAAALGRDRVRGAVIGPIGCFPDRNKPIRDLGRLHTCPPAHAALEKRRGCEARWHLLARPRRAREIEAEGMRATGDGRGAHVAVARPFPECERIPQRGRRSRAGFARGRAHDERGREKDALVLLARLSPRVAPGGDVREYTFQLR